MAAKFEDSLRLYSAITGKEMRGRQRFGADVGWVFCAMSLSYAHSFMRHQIER